MITLDANNMYANGKVITFPNRTFKLIRTRMNIVAREGDVYYTVREGDRLEQIAWLFWNKKVSKAMNYWYVLMDANNITNPLDLSAYIGKDILVPDILRIKLEFEI